MGGGGAVKDRLARRRRKERQAMDEWSHAWEECNGTLTRERIREIQCPKCGSGIGQRCTSLGGREREPNHIERLALRERRAREIMSSPPPYTW